ncbi:unnamed protein product [Coregonus sp. 'balchen']|nr:unnamed protein product [Coregonus sp. 'balchen']
MLKDESGVQRVPAERGLAPEPPVNRLRDRAHTTTAHHLSQRGHSSDPATYQKPAPSSQPSQPAYVHVPDHHASVPHTHTSGPAMGRHGTNQRTPMDHPVVEVEPPRRRVSADHIYTTHRETHREGRQAPREEVLTEGLLKSRKAVLPSEIRRREKSVDDPQRGEPQRVPGCCQDDSATSTGMEWESYGIGGRRTSREDSKEWETRPQDRDQQQQQHWSSHSQDTEETGPARPMEISSHSKPRQQQLQQAPQPLHQPLHQPLRQHQQSQSQPGQQRGSDSAVYLQSGASLHQAKHSSMEPAGPRGPPKPKVRTRSMSDIGVSQRPAAYRSMERAAASRETATAAQLAREGGVAVGVLHNGEVGALDTRVSVAQLRHSYLENANRKPEL